MSDALGIVLTSAFTILGGIAVIVGGQIIIKFFIEPIHEQSKIVGEIAESLIFYARLYSNPGSGKPEEMYEAAKDLRQLASQLIATTHAIRGYKFWQSRRIVRHRDDVTEASRNLIGLSNSISEGDPRHNMQRAEQIRRGLHIEIDI